MEERGLGKGTVNYKLRDWLFSRQRYWGEPFPIIHCADGTIKSLPEKDLPVLLPPMTDFNASKDGEPPLSKAIDWVNTVDEETGLPAKRETNIMPQWAGSSWYFLRYCDPTNDKEAWSREAEQYWMPVDTYIGGAEHAVLHLLYARFWHKVLFDAGLVSTKEPFQKLFNQGMITAYSYRDDNGKYYHPTNVERRGNDYFVKATGVKVNTQVEKMSKSRYNVANPDDVVRDYGADALRLYEMFMGPVSAEKPWTDEGINGASRFLKRVWGLFIDDDDKLAPRIVAEDGDAGLDKLIHKTIKGVSEDMEKLSFNTAIAKMMELTNAIYKTQKVNQSVMEAFVLLLSPIAPHMMEELWQRLGHTSTLAYEKWPVYDEAMLQEDEMEIVVQIMGKKRATISVPVDAEQEDVLKIAQAEPRLSDYLSGKQILKVIYVPKRLLNIVVK